MKLLYLSVYLFNFLFDIDMMEKINEIDIAKIKKGDNHPLTQIFEQCYQKALKSIRSVMRCKKEDAEDVLMDSIITLRDAIIDNQYRNENVGAYLTTVAINKLKNKNKKDYRIEFMEEEALLLRGGISEEEKTNSSPKVDQIINSINELKEKCKALLTRNLIDGVSLNTLVSELEYNSYDVVKTSKARCMSKLRQIIQTNQINA